MEIKETPWESRNLGVAGCEFYVDTQDTIDEVFRQTESCTASYQVMHIKSGNTDVLIEAQNRGFTFIEMNIQLQKQLNKIEIPEIYSRFLPHISYEYADTKQIDEVLNIIRRGDMFTTDKVARDPYFGSEKAGQRYAYWTKDLLKNGAKLILIKYKNQTVGFDVCIDKGNGVFEAFIGGIFPEYSNTGLGFAPIYLIMKSVEDTTAKKMITGVSSNNIPILKLHELFGFTVGSVSYTLIKHLK